MSGALALPFFQRGIVEILLLAALAAVVGTWVVLRGLSFFAHAAGTATVPGLVLADGLGFSPLLGALGAALVAALAVGLVAGRRSVGTDSATALVLAGALAAGVILASDLFASQGRIDRLLFGSLLAVGPGELAATFAVLAAAAAATFFLGPRWLGNGFGGRPAFSSRGADLALVLLVAVAVVATLAVVGALLVAAILVLPAATTRLFTARVPSWQLATGALAAVEGIAGMFLALGLNVPPGAMIAVLAGVVFAIAAVLRWAAGRAGRAPAVAAVAAVLAVIAAGCSGSTGGPADGPTEVTATTTQVADIVREVGGRTVDVTQILRPNSEAHDYEPLPGDVAGVADSRLVFASGLGIDQWARELVGQSGSEARVIDLAAGLPVRLPAPGGGVDPHWWLDPRNVEAAATRVERALVAADPSSRAQVTANARAYRARVRRVDRAIRACLAKVPAGRRKIVTDHDAFGYFTSRYGIRSVGAVFPSNSTQGQASAGDVARLEATIRRERVTAVFPEASLNADLARRIARDTGATSEFTLNGDSLGAPGSPSGTLLGAAQANAAALAAGMSEGRVRCPVKSA